MKYKYLYLNSCTKIWDDFKHSNFELKKNQLSRSNRDYSFITGFIIFFYGKTQILSSTFHPKNVYPIRFLFQYFFSQLPHSLIYSWIDFFCSSLFFFFFPMQVSHRGFENLKRVTRRGWNDCIWVVVGCGTIALGVEWRMERLYFFLYIKMEYRSLNLGILEF